MKNLRSVSKERISKTEESFSINFPLTIQHICRNKFRIRESDNPLSLSLNFDLKPPWQECIKNQRNLCVRVLFSPFRSSLEFHLFFFKPAWICSASCHVITPCVCAFAVFIYPRSEMFCGALMRSHRIKREETGLWKLLMFLLLLFARSHSGSDVMYSRNDFKIT